MPQTVSTIKETLILIYNPHYSKEINLAVENTSAKKFSVNSSIGVKDYLLNKNEKNY